MIRLFCILLLIFAYIHVGLSKSYAQYLTVPTGLKKVSVCRVNFMIPENLKNQKAKGIDSCVAEFENSEISLGIDYGSHGGVYKNDGKTVDFKEAAMEIDGKKAQLVTFKNTQGEKKFGAGLYVLIYEAPDGTKTSLKMTIDVKNERDLETAKQVFQSIRFVKTIGFGSGFIDIYNGYKTESKTGPDFDVQYVYPEKPELSGKATMGVYTGDYSNFAPPKNAKTKNGLLGNRRIKWHIWEKQENNQTLYIYETLIRYKNGGEHHFFISGTDRQEVRKLLEIIDSFRNSNN